MQIQSLVSNLKEAKEQIIKYQNDKENFIKKENIKSYMNIKSSNLKLIECFLYSFIITLFFNISLQYKIIICVVVLIIYKFYINLNLTKYSNYLVKIQSFEEKITKIKLEMNKDKSKIIELLKYDLEKALNNNDCEFKLEIQEDNEIDCNDFIKEEKFYKYKLNEEQNKVKVDTINDTSKIYLTNNDALIYYKELNSKILNMEDYILNNKEFLRFKNYLELSNIQPIDIGNISTLNSFRRLNDILEGLSELIKYRKSIIENKFNKLYSGYVGEGLVNNYLNKYKYINLNNIRLKVDEVTTENDNIILSNKGIFVLEVKNWGSSGKYDIQIDKDNSWYKLFKNGKESEKYDKSPFEQNKVHIESLEKLINEKLNRKIYDENYIKVKGLVVMSNDIVNIKNDSEKEVYRVDQINDYINSFNESLDDKELSKIKEIILSEKLEDAKQEYDNYKDEIDNNVNIFKKIVILGFENINTLEIIFNKYIEYKDIIEEYKITEFGFEIDKFNKVYKNIMESTVEYDFSRLYNEKVSDTEDNFLEDLMVKF